MRQKAPGLESCLAIADLLRHRLVREVSFTVASGVAPIAFAAEFMQCLELSERKAG